MNDEVLTLRLPARLPSWVLWSAFKTAEETPGQLPRLWQLVVAVVENGCDVPGVDAAMIANTLLPEFKQFVENEVLEPWDQQLAQEIIQMLSVCSGHAEDTEG